MGWNVNLFGTFVKEKFRAVREGAVNGQVPAKPHPREELSPRESIRRARVSGLRVSGQKNGEKRERGACLEHLPNGWMARTDPILRLTGP